MATTKGGPVTLPDYQSFAERVQALLRSDTNWQDLYAGYAAQLMAGKNQLTANRNTLGGRKALKPLCCYTSIDAVRKSGFDLRYLGQSVGRITVKNGVPLLTVDKKTAQTSQNYFGYLLGEIKGEDWNTGAAAQGFKAHYRSLADRTDLFPRQKEHTVESALFSELEKEKGADKALKYIQPITCVPGVRLHAKTALSASRCSKKKAVLADPTLSGGSGGDIDLFCRRKTGNRDRLTVIEVKDENLRTEPFHLVIRQAIAYAVFIRELVRSRSGPDWMKLWGMGNPNQPWRKGFIIDAVAAMPKGKTTEFPFAGMKLELKGENPEDPTDWIELHYIALLGDQPRDGQNVRFETSLRRESPKEEVPEAKLRIYRGTDRIGGGCTEITVGKERVLIDFGASLPGADSDGGIPDAEMAAKVFDGRPTDAVLFTHYHGDHYGLYKEIPPNVPMYIGSLAKEILQVLVSRLDEWAEEKGTPIVEEMRVYRPRRWHRLSPHITVMPLYVDHSALDAYMLYIKAGETKILFTGDFRDHGIQGARGQLWKALEKYVVPDGVDILITEGTMLSRREETEKNPIRTEQDLGRKALEMFRQRRYNFVILSSTNLDSLMMFYHYTPAGMLFICDSYQAQVMLTAMKGMEDREKVWYRRPIYQNTIYVWRDKEDEDLTDLEQLGGSLKKPIQVLAADGGLMSRQGFVFLTRKSLPRSHRRALNAFFPTDGSRNDAQLIYSMWRGYLEDGPHQDEKLLEALDGRAVKLLHTSGHAYLETIAKLIETVQPRIIVPMHTERSREFQDFPEFSAWKDRVRPLENGETLP